MKKLIILSTILMALVCFNINEVISAQETTSSIPITGKVQKLPDGWYQIPFVTDDATGTVFWLHAPDPQLSCGSSINATEVFGVAPKSVSFLDDQESRRLILAGGLPLVQWALQKRCNAAPWADVWIVYEDYQLLREKPKNSSYYYRQLQQGFYIGPITVNGTVNYEFRNQKISLGNYINFVQQIETQRREIEATAKKQIETKKMLDAFLQKFKVDIWLASNEMISRLASNPFQWKGKIVGFEAEFGGMLSEDSGIFDLGNFVLVIVKGLPSTQFTRSGEWFLLAGRVQGTSQTQLPFLGNVSVPALSFIGAAKPVPLPYE